jgi:4-diphosphocytidyl-2-C-methyl-D-erythritol kinase
VPENHREIARAKLTRSFRVLGRRDDGYHTISSEMVTLSLADELEFSDGSGLELRDAIDWIGGRPTEGLDAIAPGRNLVERALALVGRVAHVRLTKRVPPGSGLGGGSADAAAVLRWAGESDAQHAARLGADVPFCVRGGRALVGGIGEIVEPLQFIDVSQVLLIPGISVSTAAVYQAFDEIERSLDVERSNDLEPAALAVEPRLARYRDLLREVSALPPMLAGSGATWFIECSPANAGHVAEELRRAVLEERLVAHVVATKTDA